MPDRPHGISAPPFTSEWLQQAKDYGRSEVYPPPRPVIVPPWLAEQLNQEADDA